MLEDFGIVCFCFLRAFLFKQSLQKNRKIWIPRAVKEIRENTIVKAVLRVVSILRAFCFFASVDWSTY